MKYIANNWARNPRHCGRKIDLTFQVGGDGSSVIVMVTRADGHKMRMNFTRAHAAALASDLQAATTLPTGFDPHGVMKQ